MACYVDALMDCGWKLGVSCHLIADTPEELHRLARRIGMRPEWVQRSRRGALHYDLTARRRQMALAAGAIDCAGNRKLFCDRMRKTREAH